MIELGKHIRDEVIPDISVKMLRLWLADDENGILIPKTSRETKTMEFRADWALREVVENRLKEDYKALPLVLRKKKIYEATLKLAKAKNFESKVEELSVSGCVPIMMRKHLLYKQCRAG